MRIFAFIFVILLSSCSANRTEELISLRLKTLQGEEYAFQKIKENKATVVYFLAPECPLSQNYTLPIKTIKEEYADKNIEFIGVVAGKYYTQQEIQDYVNEYNLTLPLLLDPDYTLTHLLGAKITPEVFVLSAQGNVLYSGKIDNWYISLGRNRKKPTEFYLKDALNAINSGQKISIKKTEAVGCYIE